MKLNENQVRKIIEEELDRELALDVKASLDGAMRELKFALKSSKGNKQLQNMILDAISAVKDAKNNVRVPRASRAKSQPYMGGGTWHKPGYGPTGKKKTQNWSKESW